MPKVSQTQRMTRVFAVKHGQNDFEDELNTIVDYGGKILDVIIEHTVYGEFRTRLMLSTRKDVKDYLDAMKKE